MVLSGTNGYNSVINGLLDRKAKLESRVTLLETQNAAQKEEILKLNNNIVSTEWRDIVVGKKKMISENQMNILNAVESEQKERKKKDNVVLFGVPTSKATKYEEREKEDENITFQILEVIGLSKAEQEAAKIIRLRANPTKETSKPLLIKVSFCARNPSDLV